MNSISTSVDFSKFYQFEDPMATRPLRLEPTDDWITRDYAFALARGQVQPPNPIKLVGYMGRDVMDILWSGMVWIFCVSSRVTELLQKNNITGWATYPVEVYDRKGQPLPGYHGFAVTGRECRRDRSRSQIITKQVVPGGKPFEVYKGLFFYEEDWDGNDFFIVRSYGGIVVTEKVMRLFKRAKIANVRFIPLPEVELDVILDEYGHDV
jgi:hypothetical protein